MLYVRQQVQKQVLQDMRLLVVLTSPMLLCRAVQHILLEDQSLPCARVQNRAGEFVLPGQANFSNMGPEFTLPQSVTSPEWVNVVLGNSSEFDTFYLACVSSLDISTMPGHMVTAVLLCLTLDRAAATEAAQSNADSFVAQAKDALAWSSRSVCLWLTLHPLLQMRPAHTPLLGWNSLS